MGTVTNLYDKNMQALKEKGYGDLIQTLENVVTSATVRTVDSRSGEPTFYYGDQLIHSSYNPSKEASGQLKHLQGDIHNQSSILLMGLGFGYLAEEIITHYENVSLTIVEPSLEVFKSCCESKDITGLIDNTSFIIGELHSSDNDARLHNCLDTLSPVDIKLPTVDQYAQAEIETYIKEMRIHQNRSKKGFRILVVSPLYGGSYPITGYVTDALKNMGHRPVFLDNKAFYEAKKHIEGLTGDKRENNLLMANLMTLMSKSIVTKALDMKAQVVIFMAQSPGTPEILEELREYGIPTAMWFVEDGELFEYGLKMAPFYDFFFHIQKGEYEEKLKKSGARFPYYLPLAADPSIHREIELSEEDKSRYGSDISHVGAGYFNRRNFFLGLLDYDFKLWGNDWEKPGALASILQDDGRRVSTEETVKIFNASKINLNLHSSTYTKGVNPHGDFINPRTFELAACGAFQLVDERSLLTELFEPGKEVITFNDLQSCRNAIDYYHDHPEEAAEIAKASRKRVLENHTYHHRVEEMMGVILANHEIPFEDFKENTVAALRDEAQDNEELLDLLAGFENPYEELSLDKIAEVIKQEDGELNETQAIFLLMNEFNEFAKEKGLV
jgi:spore maturation protein CgeB